MCRDAASLFNQDGLPTDDFLYAIFCVMSNGNQFYVPIVQYLVLFLQFFDKIVGDNTIAELEPLRSIAERCLSGDVVSLKELYKLSEHRINRKLYPMLIVFVVLLIALLAFLDHYFKSL